MKWLSVLLLACCVSGFAQQKTLRIAAASDLQPVMPAIAYGYEKQTGTKLEVSFGSSSELATQIINGAPFDVFLGADFVFPEKVIAANLAVDKLPVPYAKGTLVLWARKDMPIKPINMEMLSDPRIKRIAVADEFHAPYGRAAYSAMRWLKIEDKLKPKLVTAENIAQTAQFVESGNAQVGFLSLTFASSKRGKELGDFTRIPTAIYPTIKQTCVVMKAAKDPEEGRKFVNWLRSSDVQSHLPEFGLEPVQ